MKYRTKSKEVEAVQWTGGCNEVNEPEWLIQAIEDHRISFPKQDIICIDDLEWTLTVGDYIVQDPQGELHLYRPDLFEQTYEPVHPEQPP